MEDYAWGQLRRALTTAGSGQDAGARDRARKRADSWVDVLTGMMSGRIHVGSRTPVRGFPAWLTPRVIRGGFATGEAAAGGPMQDDELEWARQAGIEATRAGLFAWFLTDGGLARLGDWIENGDYRLELPEHGALLVLAQLLRTGLTVEAGELLTALEPWAAHIRFWPRVSDKPDAPGVHVATVGEVAGRLATKRPHPQVEAEREALTVWAPFTDRVVEHWWRTRTDEGTDTAHPEAWADDAAALLAEYDRLTARHRLTRKHAGPKGNLQHLLAGMRERLADPSRPPSKRVQHAVASVVAKRGEPGSAGLRALREGQGDRASRPSHAVLAHEVAQALTEAGITGAVPDPVALVEGLPGASLPSVTRSLMKATAAPLEELLTRGIVRSAETLAVLAPQLTAETVASRYADPAMGLLAKRIHLAFASRRSLLLLDHQSQVRIEEIPWFTALERAGTTGGGEGLAHTQATDLASLALRHFPGTMLPNSLLRELARLYRLAGLDLPLTYELASDIFMGTFSTVYLRAAKAAATVVGDTLYSRYYDIDYETIGRMHAVEPTRGRGRGCSTVPEFDAMTLERAGVEAAGLGMGPATNGRVIEQAQILTTQNLAAVVLRGVQLDPVAQARGAWRATKAHLAKAAGDGELRHRKNAAYAWRQAVFFLALAGQTEAEVFLAGATTDGLPGDAAVAAAEILGSLADVVLGGASRRAPFLGWVEWGEGALPKPQ